MRPAAVVIVLLLLAGCVHHGRGETESRDRLVSADDRAPATIYALDVYHLTVPFGTISGNSAFWEKLDAGGVDSATLDLLHANGVRVGQAAVSEWEQVREIIEQNPASSHRMSMVAGPGRSIEVEMRRNIPRQDIFYIDQHHGPRGRSYEHCVNLISIAFEPAVGKPDSLRVALVPMVRDIRRRLEWHGTREDRQLQYAAPERIYDVNLRADIPLDSFMVVAPSSEGRWPTSIGNAFFTLDGAGERLEQVLLLVPQAYPVAGMQRRELP